jgi:hypothetical protein
MPPRLVEGIGDIVEYWVGCTDVDINPLGYQLNESEQDNVLLIL